MKRRCPICNSLVDVEKIKPIGRPRGTYILPAEIQQTIRDMLAAGRTDYAIGKAVGSPPSTIARYRRNLAG